MKLGKISFAIPDMRISAEEIADWTDSDSAFIKNKIGIAHRHFMNSEETVTSLAGKACRTLFDATEGLTPDKVGLLVLVTQNPDFRLPHTSALLQAALNLDKTCACFDVGLGCSGYVYGLTIAMGFMTAQGIKNALLVTCDPYSKVMRKDDKNTVALFGDAATVSWLNDSTGARSGIGDFGTDGDGAESLIIRAGGSKHPIGGLWREEPVCPPVDEAALYMHGQSIYNFMMRRVPLTVSACLEKNNLDLEDIDYFVFHQASRFMVESLRARLRLPADKVPINVSEYGNTVSSSIPLILSDMMEKNLLQGKKVLICGFGVGLSWATNILFF